jgi:hypothetical protein
LDWESHKTISGDLRSQKSSKPQVTEITKMLQKNQGKCSQEIEIYQKEHGEKLNQKVSDEIDKAEVNSRKEKMEIQQRVTQNKYENESEAVKATVREEYEKQKKGAKEAKMSHSSSIVECSPEDIAK